MSELIFKVLNEDGTPCHGGSGKWHLPRGTRPGKWMPPIKRIVPCIRGYHLCRRNDLVHWLGPAIWIAEARGKRIEEDDKIVVSEARLVRRVTTWNERSARLFACDCAEHVLPIYAKCHPDDRRPAECVSVARRFANGEATSEEMNAARAAAWDAWAARDARAARAAAWAAWAVRDAWDASTARVVAWTARVARDAVDAEYTAQTKLLMQYLEIGEENQ